MKKFILHAGMPKTASSALQKKLFPEASEVTYLGRRGWSYSESDLTGNLSDLFRTSSSSANLKEKVCAVTDHLSEYHGSSSFLFSDETILKDALPVYPGGARRTLDDLATTINTFQESLPNDTNFHLMLVIRWQPTWLASRFAEDSKVALFSGQKQFTRYALDEADKAARGESSIDYLRIYRKFSSLLGEERCHIFFYEELLKDPESFVDHIN